MSDNRLSLPAEIVADKRGLSDTIDPELRADIEGSYSLNTMRAYKADWADWCAWCERNGKPPCPAEPRALRDYLVDLASTVKLSTLRRRLAAIVLTSISAKTERAAPVPQRGPSCPAAPVSGALLRPRRRRLLPLHRRRLRRRPRARLARPGRAPLVRHRRRCQDPSPRLVAEKQPLRPMREAVKRGERKSGRQALA